jgi:hypothetical protein
MNRFAKIVGDRVKGGLVVYGGSDRQARSDWEVWPVSDIDGILNTVVRFFA